MPREYTHTGANKLHIGHKPRDPEAPPEAPLEAQVFAPGETLPVDDSCIKALDKSAAVRSGVLKPGKVAMPPPAAAPTVEALPEDLIKALGYIKLCDSAATLSKWQDLEIQGSKRSDILDAIKARARDLK